MNQTINQTTNKTINKTVNIDTVQKLFGYKTKPYKLLKNKLTKAKGKKMDVVVDEKLLDLAIKKGIIETSNNLEDLWYAIQKINRNTPEEITNNNDRLIKIQQEMNKLKGLLYEKEKELKTSKIENQRLQKENIKLKEDKNYLVKALKQPTTKYSLSKEKKQEMVPVQQSALCEVIDADFTVNPDTTRKKWGKINLNALAMNMMGAGTSWQKNS